MPLLRLDCSRATILNHAIGSRVFGPEHFLGNWRSDFIDNELADHNIKVPCVNASSSCDEFGLHLGHPKLRARSTVDTSPPGNCSRGDPLRGTNLRALDRK